MDAISGWTVCLMHSPYSLFISLSQSPPPLSCSLIRMQVSGEQVRGGKKKAIEKATAAASRER